MQHKERMYHRSTCAIWRAVLIGALLSSSGSALSQDPPPGGPPPALVIKVFFDDRGCPQSVDLDEPEIETRSGRKVEWHWVPGHGGGRQL